MPGQRFLPPKAYQRLFESINPAILRHDGFYLSPLLSEGCGHLVCQGRLRYPTHFHYSILPADNESGRLDAFKFIELYFNHSPSDRVGLSRLLGSGGNRAGHSRTVGTLVFYNQRQPLLGSFGHVEVSGLPFFSFDQDRRAG